MYKNTLTVHVEPPSLEMSKFSLYFSGSCIPINPKLSPRIFSCFQFDFSVKSIKFSTRNSKYQREQFDQPRPQAGGARAEEDPGKIR